MEILSKYKTFQIPKASGGFRTIEAPEPELMEIQRKLLLEFEKEPILKPSYFAHGFMRGRNIVTCAKPHVKKKYLLRIDVKDFFNSIKYEHFLTELKISDEKLKEKLLLCFRNGKYLSQGSPTSPFLSNAYMRRFDWMMSNYGIGIWDYTRYADDMYFSFDDIKHKKEIFKCVYPILYKMLKLKVNKEKTKFMRDGMRKEVLGIVVNEKINLKRKQRKIMRAIKHNGITNNHQKGMVAFEYMIYHQKKFPKKIDRIIEGRKLLQRI